MAVFTYSASTIPAVLIALLVMFLYKGLRSKQIFMLVAALAFSAIVIHSMKSFYGADRPLAYFAKKIPSQEGMVNAPFERHRTSSFPSGHTQTAFSVAVLMVLLFRRHAVAWFSWAFLVAVSRVYLGVHFPFDVLVGGLTGAIVTFVTVKIATLPSKEEIRADNLV
jgi:membrane-associated phospholipid phosphatase